MEPPADSAVNGPLVSVIMAVYNRAEWVGRAIESVLAQNYRCFELLVIDDGSTDGTSSVLEKFKSQLTILKQSHAGAEAARNLGLEHARGDFIAFIDSDDVWYPDRLSKQLPLFEREDVGVVFGNAALVDYQRTTPGRQKRRFFDNVRPSRGRVTTELARGCFVPFSSALVRRKCFEEIGGFTHGCVAADYMKWIEISAGWEFDYVSSAVFEYAIHPGGLSYNLILSLEDRLNSFRKMLFENNDPTIKRAVLRIIFNTYLSLWIARVRSRTNDPGLPERPSAYIQDVSLDEKLIWSVAFVWNQLRTRSKWLILNLANALSDERTIVNESYLPVHD